MKIKEILNEARYKQGGKFHTGGYQAYKDVIDLKNADAEYDAAGDPDESGDYYEDVPYKYRALAKKHGGRWDPNKKSWYFQGYNSVWGYRQALEREQDKASSAPTGRTYLNVPYRDKDEAKAAGARWDNDAKKWFYPGDHLPTELKRFAT